VPRDLVQSEQVFLTNTLPGHRAKMEEIQALIRDASPPLD